MRVIQIVSNIKIAFILNDIANMLDIKGENFFKIRAYKKAAHVIRNLPIELDELEESKLYSIEGIGKAIGGKVEELLNTGYCRYYEDLKREVPRGLIDMLKIPGLGPKRINTIYKTLGISSVEQLEKAAKRDKLRHLPGFGIKIQQSILQAIKIMEDKADSILYPMALTIANQIISQLKDLPELKEISIAGSLRRKKETVKDIDIIVSSVYPDTVIDVFANLPEVSEIISRGHKKTSVRLNIGIQTDLLVVEPRAFPSALLHFTGSKEHNSKLRSYAIRKGFKLNEYGIYDDENQQILYPKSEKEIYKFLDMPYIVPQLREDRGEIEAGLKNTLPELVNLGQIRGDLHTHSNFSDGIDTIEAMAKSARALGYEYIAVTDHSKTLKVARGLDEKRLLEQIEIINKINYKLRGIRILTGIEVDILPDGTLDFENEILKELDIVIASIHSGFHQDSKEINNRIMKACANPYVDILGHPTGRIIGRRPPYKVDVDFLIRTAAQTGTILEINSSPDRLDLNDSLVKRAKEQNIKIAINTDAHSIDSLKDMIYGINVAQRGWLEKNDIINTLSLKELLELLKRGRIREA